VAREIERRAPRAVVFVARGSSDNAAVYGRYVLEVRNRLLTSLAAPSTVTLYGAGPRLDGTVVVAVSQSGRGEDVRAYLAHARAVGRLADALAPFDGLAVVGRGFAYPAALEIALKLKEAARVRAEPFSAADFQHGPVTLADRSHPALVCDVGGKSAAEARAAM